jgi:hypothetical protein
MPLSAPGPLGSAPLPLGCHAPHRARALNALSGPRAGVPTAQRRSDRLSEITDVALAHPVPTMPSPLSEAVPPLCQNPATVRPSDAVVSFVHGERRPSSPLTVLRPWSVELTFPSLLTVVGPPPATVAPPHRKNASAEPVFSPSPSTRSSSEPSPPPPCLAGSFTVVGAYRRRLRRLRRCGVAAGRAAMRAWEL